MIVFDNMTHLESGSVWSNQPLSSLHKPLLVSHQIPDLDDVRSHIILQHSNSLQCTMKNSNSIELYELDNYNVQVLRLVHNTTLAPA